MDGRQETSPVSLCATLGLSVSRKPVFQEEFLTAASDSTHR